ncbi:MAG: endolytic transglycosylase MltG [Bacteroidales bacterium]|nr:endolytic transglycosylase MltG [Bacteroidales bacterium]
MNRKVILWTGLALATLALLFAGVKAYRMWYDRKASNFTGAMDVYVYPGMTRDLVLEQLAGSGHVRKAASLRRAMAGFSDVQVGHYLIDSTCSSMYVARMLGKGWQTPVNLTLSGSIKTPASLARKIGTQMLVDSADVARFVRNPDSLRRYGIDPKQLFTIVIPDTYQMQWTASVREIMDRLARECDAWWTPERKESARKQGLTPQEVSVLASIVDGETQYVPEQPKIAGVYLNRLRMGMKLQADPTVAFCFDYQLRRILLSHLEVDSPYNTYRNFGLPPGPISCPPKTCLEAVLHPDSHNYLYFCADPAFNGSHRFASSYAEHLLNARAYQRALNERNASRGGK